MNRIFGSKYNQEIGKPRENTEILLNYRHFFRECFMSEPELSQNAQAKSSFFVVGIGASAGGLRALEEFFENMPVNSDEAFVVIQHLSPDFKSLMKELLERRQFIG